MKYTISDGKLLIHPITNAVPNIDLFLAQQFADLFSRLGAVSRGEYVGAGEYHIYSADGVQEQSTAYVFYLALVTFLT